MKKREVWVVVILVVALLAVLSWSYWGDLLVKGQSEVASGDLQTVEPLEPTPEPTPELTPEPTLESTPEPTLVPTDEEETASFISEEDKLYFRDAVSAYTECGNLQSRIDAAEIKKYHVYDVMNASDKVVMDAFGNEITADYLLNLPEKVTFLRDGYNMLVYSLNEFPKEKEHIFRIAKDSKVFSDTVLCKEHKSVKSTSTIRVGYVNAVEETTNEVVGCKGDFTVDRLDRTLFKTFVLVERTIVKDGEKVTVYTWVIRLCLCDDKPDGKKDDDKPDNSNEEAHEEPRDHENGEEHESDNTKNTGSGEISEDDDRFNGESSSGDRQKGEDEQHNQAREKDEASTETTAVAGVPEATSADRTKEESTSSSSNGSAGDVSQDTDQFGN